MFRILIYSIVLFLTALAHADVGDYILNQVPARGPLTQRNLKPYAGRIVGWPSNINFPEAIILGSGLTLTGNTLTAAGGVTSIGLSVPTGLSVTGSPLTANGTLAITTALSGIIKGNGSGFLAAVAGTDYLTPTGSGAALTGITAGQISGLGTLATQSATITDYLLSATATSTYVPKTLTVNGYALSGNISLVKADVGLGNVENVALATWTGSTSITTLGTISAGSIPHTLVSGLGTLATQSATITDYLLSATAASSYQPLASALTTLASSTAAGLALMDDANNTAQRATLGLGTLATQSGTFSGTSSGTNTGDNAVNSNYSGLVTNATHTGDATGATALTVVGINNTLLSGLATGILKNTTATGVPSIAVAGTDYQTPLTFSTGLTNTAGTITVNTSQNIAKLSNLGNGFVKTSGGDGTLGVVTSIGNDDIADDSITLAKLADSLNVGAIQWNGAGWSVSSQWITPSIYPNQSLTFESNDGVNGAKFHTLGTLDGNLNENTWILPDVDGTIITTGNLTDITSVGNLSSLAVGGAIAGASSITLGTNGGTGGSVVLRGSINGSSTIDVSNSGGLQLPAVSIGGGIAITSSGVGGALGSAAFTASSAYEVPLTFSTGLTRSTNTITVNTSQNITTLSNLTNNGAVYTSGSNGTLNAGTLQAAAGGTGWKTYALGDILYASGAENLSKLSGNTDVTRKFLSQTGDGGNSAAPVWTVLDPGDIPTLNQNTAGSAASLVGSGSTTNAVDLATEEVAGTLANANTTATAANTANAIVARDASGNIAVGTITSGTWNANDIGLAYFEPGDPLSVLGVAGNSPGDHASIAATVDHTVLRMSGTSIGFGAINLAQSAAVTGNLPVTNLNSGTNASASTFWRGDATWAAPTASNVGLGNVTNDTQTKAAIVPNTAPASGQLLVGNAGGTAYSPVTLGTDATLASTGALTIANNAVTLGKMATMATASILGRNTAGTGNVEVLSASTTKTLLSLNNVDNVSINSWTGSSNITTTGTVTSGTWSGSFGSVSGANLTNVNAATLGGATFASPGAIGATTASTGRFTAVTLTGVAGSGHITVQDGNGFLTGTRGIFRAIADATYVIVNNAGTNLYRLAGATDGVTIQNGAGSANGSLTAGKVVFGGPVIYNGSQALSGAGAVNVTTAVTKYTSTGGAQALTLADGVDGQEKIIIHVVDGGSGVLTPTTKTGFTSLTFTNAGDTATLMFSTTIGWTILAANGTTITP